jgi:hydroxymethylglutaryl-CoA lyase
MDDVVPTATKIELIKALYHAGIRRLEASAFVSSRAVPQLADAAEIVAQAQALPGFQVQVLVPTSYHAARAVGAGARGLAFVVSVSPKHNQSNVRRTPLESVEEYARIVREIPAGTAIRLNIATAFDCPFDGTVSRDATLALLEHLVPMFPAEICLCDTTGRVTPDRVRALFVDGMARFPNARNWAYHGHDTYGLGVANVLAALEAGVRVIDASAAGLGGCPFAPGATGNVATEDVVWTFEQMGFATGIDLEALVAVARSMASLPGGLVGGRVRTALEARRCAARKANACSILTVTS